MIHSCEGGRKRRAVVGNHDTIIVHSDHSKERSFILWDVSLFFIEANFFRRMKKKQNQRRVMILKWQIS